MKSRKNTGRTSQGISPAGVHDHVYDFLVLKVTGYRKAQPLLIVFLSLLIDGCTKSQSIGEPVTTGLDAREPEMVTFFDSWIQAVRTKPDSSLARGYLGMAYDANGFNAAAEASYLQAEKLDPEDFRWPYYRASALASLNRYEDALVSLDRAIILDADYAPAWLLRGAWLLDLDQHNDAAIAYRRAADLAADKVTSAAAGVGIARTLLRQEEPQEAAALLEKILATYNHPHIFRLLATAHKRLGRVEELPGSSQAKEAVALTWPDARRTFMSAYVRGLSGRLLMAENLLKQEKPRHALKILEPLREKTPHGRDLLNNLSVAYRQLGRRTDAFKVLQDGLDSHPDFHLFHFNIAVHYEELGDAELALKHLRRAVELDPSLRAGHQRIVDLLVREKRFPEALAALDAAARYDKAEASAFLYAGMIAGAAENWPIAVERFRQALKLDPALSRAQLFLGRSLAETGRFIEARAAIIKAEHLGVPAKDLDAAKHRLEELAGRLF